MGGNNEFFEIFERNKYLRKLPSMQRVKGGLKSIVYTKSGSPDGQMNYLYPLSNILRLHVQLFFLLHLLYNFDI